MGTSALRLTYPYLLLIFIDIGGTLSTTFGGTTKKEKSVLHMLTIIAVTEGELIEGLEYNNACGVNSVSNRVLRTSC